MRGAKPKVERTQERLSNYKFDTTDYIVLDTGVRRDAATGQLLSQREPARPLKPEK